MQSEYIDNCSALVFAGIAVVNAVGSQGSNDSVENQCSTCGEVNG